MDKAKRLCGTYAGVALAAALLPGISVRGEAPQVMAVVIGGAIFVILNQLIYSYPHDIRRAPALMLLILGAIGVVQDTLVWLVVSWAGGKLGGGLHVDGFVAALLGGLIVRAVVLLALATTTAKERQSASDASS
ncbi:phage holin family protein [Streptomyces sp. NPDC000410]|uniref:phage holin family protein n=1 Tax=Streptomyces sp. NPDC000410 TaxID=3154254 RepID=UPI00332D796D